MLFWTPKTRIQLKNSSDESALSGEMGEFLAQKEKTIFLRRFLNKRKFFFVIGLFAVIFLIIFSRAVYLQIVRGNYYAYLSENNRVRTQIIPAYRGIIYDRNNIPLVKNKSIFNLSLIPNKLSALPDERDGVLEIVAQAAGLPKKEIETVLLDYQAYPDQAVLIKSNLSHEEVLILTKHSFDFPAIVITEQIEREYIGGAEYAKLHNLNNKQKVDSLSHVLGYIGPISKEEYGSKKKDGYYLHDFIGKTGVEMSYEKILRGQFGKKQIEIDALGKEKRIIAKEYAIAGKDLTLAMDLDIQANLERIVQNNLYQFGKKRAVAILMNPNNGDVLALVSLPSFSNNDFTGGIPKNLYDKLINNPDEPLFFRAIAGEYPSGSVIKPLWAAAALEEGVITPKTSVLSVGGISVGKWFFPDWLGGGHGLTNVTRAIAQSINTFFYYIGGGFDNFNGLGLDRMIKYAIMFGLGKKTGIDLPFEKEGFLPTEEWKLETQGQEWYIGDTYHLSIGQGFLLVTPVQMAVLTSAIANGGTIIVPRLVKKITDKNAEKEVETGLKGRVEVKTENLKTVSQGMRETVTYGSASKLNGLAVKVAGKTGTAQTSQNRPPHAWFTGFFPYENPELVITVLVEEGGEGSGIATQIARDFIGWYALNIKN